MSLEQKITEDLKIAMKSREEHRVSCLRMLKTAIKNRQVEKGEHLKDDEIHAVISSLIRKGKEAADEYRKGDREDLAAKEERELEIFYGYLPKQLDPGEIENIVREIVSELSADSPRDMGRVMKAAMARMAGKAQGKEVGEIARKLLSRSE